MLLTSVLAWVLLGSADGPMCAHRRRFLYSIAVRTAIQWSVLFQLKMTASLALVGAEIWSENSQFHPAVNFTVVTAMFDIGRGQWKSEYARPYSQYLSLMEPVMTLRVNLVAFADSIAAVAIRRLRHHLQRQTYLVEMRLHDLPYFRLKTRIRDIMKSKHFRWNNPLAFRRHPEANVPEYDILMLSKLFFVHEATRLDPFNSSYFIWLDGGYGNGQTHIFPEDGVWYPRNLFQHREKITMIERGAGIVEVVRKHAQNLHKLPAAVVVGGFFGGGRKAVRRLFHLEQAVVEEWLARGVIDDDQSCRVMAYYKDPSLFRLVDGDWWDAFRLFNNTVNTDTGCPVA